MKLFALISLFAISASAHVEPGVYNGRTETGAACSMLAEETYFEGGVAHPLNERVKIRVGSDLFVVRHPAAIDSQQATVTFNHDSFEGLVATPQGGRALIVAMSHDAGREGPTGYRLIDHQWRTNTRAALNCQNLVLVQRIRR